MAKFPNLQRLVGRTVPVNVGAIPTSARPPANPTTRWAQARLAEHGHYIGRPADGVNDTTTANHIAAFQRSRGLQQTGLLDAGTHQALAAGTSSSGSASTPPSTGRRARRRAGDVTAETNASATTTQTTSTNQGDTTMDGQAMVIKDRRGSWVPTGERNYLALSGATPTTTIAPAATFDYVNQPQKQFRGEHIVVDALSSQAVAGFFTLVTVKVGVNPQISGQTGAGEIPLAIFAANQAGATDFAMDIADSGCTMTLTVRNNDSAAHALNLAVFGRVVRQTA